MFALTLGREGKHFFWPAYPSNLRPQHRLLTSLENMTETKTAVAKDGRVLPVLQKDYKKMYEDLQRKQQLKDEGYRRNQLKKDSSDTVGFGGAVRCTSFKQKRYEENQKSQQRSAQRPEQKKAPVHSSAKRSPFASSGYTGPEPDSPDFDTCKHGLMAPPRTRNLLNGKYID